MLEEHRPFIREAGLNAELRGVQKSEADPGQSELTVVFTRNGRFADIFEFFVQKSGEPQATLGEIEQWLRDELRSLPMRHASP